VLLCDIGLPDGSGYEVISQIKQKRPIKAVAITGFGTEEDVRAPNEAGFDFHLVKPVDLHELPNGSRPSRRLIRLHWFSTFSAARQSRH